MLRECTQVRHCMQPAHKEHPGKKKEKGKPDASQMVTDSGWATRKEYGMYRSYSAIIVTIGISDGCGLWPSGVKPIA